MRLIPARAAAFAASVLFLTATQVWSADAPTGTLTGHLNDRTGKAAAGVKVELARIGKKNQTDPPPASQPKGKPAGLSATTDDQGNFEIDDVPAGQYNATAHKDNAKAQTTVNVIAGRTLDVKLQLVLKVKKRPA